MMQIQFKTHTFKKSEQIEGVLYVICGDSAFPRDDWNEQLVPTLSQWIEQIIDFIDGKINKIEMWFWNEEFYYMEGEVGESNRIYLKCKDTENYEYYSCSIEFKKFIKNVDVVVEQVLSIFKKHSWDNYGVKRLEHLLIEFRKKKNISRLQLSDVIKSVEKQFLWIDKSEQEMIQFTIEQCDREDLSDIVDDCKMTLLNYFSWEGDFKLVKKIIDKFPNIDVGGICWWDTDLKNLSTEP